MDSLIPVLENGLVVVAFISVFLLFLVNGYSSLRKRFSIKVNCWFCNTNSRVAYENANCFVCKHCGQYNGFNPDGSYNKYIPEQYDEKRNTRPSVTKQNNDKANTNGFCKNCNINQDLKVKQLAAFVPFNEKNFDNEIAEYQKKLEEVYKLCSKCENVLRVTLSVQNSWFFGKTVNYMRKMQKSGTTLLDLNKSSHGMTKNRKRSLVMKIMQTTQILLAIFILYNNLFVKTLITNTHVPDVDIIQYIPTVVIHKLEELEVFFQATWNSTEKYVEKYAKVDYLPKHMTSDKYKVAQLSTVGMLVQLLLLLWDHKSYSKMKDVVAWIGLTGLSWLPHSTIFHPYVQVVQSQLALYVIHSILFGRFLVPKRQIRLTKRKLQQNSTPYDSYAEYSDQEELNEDLSNLSKNSTETCSTSKSKRSWSKSEYAKIAANVLRKLNPSKESDKVKVTNPSLNKSLNNLHLTGAATKLKNLTRPVISPPKFTATTNVATVNNMGSFVDLSRSSSATSGFGSNVPEPDNSLPHSRKNSFSEESDISSCSELKRVFNTPPNPFMTNNFTPDTNFNKQKNLHSSFQRIQTDPNPTYLYSRPLSAGCNNFSYNQNGFVPTGYNLPPGLPRNVFTPMSVGPGFNSENNFPSQLNSTYRNENTFYPNLNQNSMLYIQVNKNQDLPQSVSKHKKGYSSKLFNMDALEKLRQQTNNEFDEISCHISDKFKL